MLCFGSFSVTINLRHGSLGYGSQVDFWGGIMLSI